MFCTYYHAKPDGTIFYIGKGGENNPNTRRIKFKDVVFVSIQSLADFENVHYKTIAYRMKTNPVKWGYEILV